MHDVDPYRTGATVADDDRRDAAYGLGIAAIIVNALGAAAFLYYYLAVVPKFDAMFKSLGGKLPGLTQVVLTLSQWLAGNQLVLVVVYGFVVLACVRLFRSHGQVIAIAALIHGALLITLAALTKPAIFYPIKELQKALS